MIAILLKTLTPTFFSHIFGRNMCGSLAQLVRAMES